MLGLTTDVLYYRKQIEVIGWWVVADRNRIVDPINEIPPIDGADRLGDHPTPARSNRVHLQHLDGMRGLASLYVVLHHCAVYAFWPTDGAALHGWKRLVYWPFSFGHYSVVIFIVLSGYCLMLPIANSSVRKFPGGVGRYIQRRALRIIPPYYAALLLSLLLISLLPQARIATDPAIHWRDWLPAFSLDALVPHLLLIHNLRESWWARIDGPTWSVATEWQLYFLLPPLVFLWRRAGALAMALTGCTLGLALWHFVPAISQACPWFAGCFAVGAAAATFNFPADRAKTITTPVLLAITGVLILLSIAAVTVGLPYITSRIALTDLLVGFAAASAMCLLTQKSQEANADAKRPLALRLLESRFCVGLGLFSYSLYLVHGPIVNTFQMLAHLWGLSLGAGFVLLLLVALPVSLVVGYVFYRLVERPLLQRRG